jgi:hypothetical protein
MNYMSFSVVDLMHLPDFKLASKLDDKEALQRILWNLGMDVSQDYHWNYCLHRCLTTNIPQKNYRIEGFERLDSEWLRGGHASLTAHIYASKNREMIDELESLNPRGSLLEGEYEGHEEIPDLEIISFDEEISEEDEID